MTTFARDSSGHLPAGSPAAGQEVERRPEPEPGSALSTLPPASSPGSTDAPRIDWAFVRRHPAHFIAFGGGIGLSPVAPGTAGTLATLPLFWVLNYFLALHTLLMFIGAMFIAGVWACAVTGRALGEHDHGGMVWDEITAFCLVLLFTPNNMVWQSFAFLLFRVFDIIKPPPIGYYDKRLRGGFGVMFDDILAAFYALLCLAGWKAFAT
jgi:phosphatidylglycerophosphatase A